MTLLTWIVLGLIAGLVTTAIVNHGAIALEIALGVAGAVGGGLIFPSLADGFADGDVARSELPGLFVALVGAALVLAIHHALSWRRLA